MKMNKAKPRQFSPLIILPTGTPASTITAACGAGYVPVIVDEPEKVKIIFPATDVIASDLLICALVALDGGTLAGPKEHFVKEFTRRMLAKEIHFKPEPKEMPTNLKRARVTPKLQS